ncbi:MAG: hypothetical protein AAGC55_33690, partial [Myxococcota bacterium]
MTYSSADRGVWPAVPRLPLTVLLCSLAAACGNTDTDASGLGIGDGPDSWLYVQTTVATPDGRTSYLQLVEDLDFDQLDTAQAIELAGNGRVFSNGSRLFTGSAEEPTIQRWLPQPDGSLAPGERVSFANIGLSFVPFGNNFVAADKAYLFDGNAYRAVMWDPDRIELAGEIDLSAVAKDGLLPDIDPGVLRGDKLFALVQQNDFASTNLFRGLQVVIIDTLSDTVEAVIEDTRCVGGFAG